MTADEAAKAQAWVNSLGKDHPLTQAEHDKLGPLQKRLDEYQAAQPKLKMDRQGSFKPGTYLNGKPVATSPEIDPGPHTYGHLLKHAVGAIARANALTHHNDNRPVPVTDAAAMKLQEKTFGKFVGWGARHPDQLDHARAILHHQAADYRRLGRAATRVAMGGGHTYNNSVETRIGEMHVHPKTDDGRRFAGEFRDDMRRRGDVTQANGALA